MPDETTAILTMALGGPDSLDDVEPYLRAVRGGRPTPKALVEAFWERYRRIGGRSPLLDISTQQARALEAQLTSEGYRVRAYVGMRHWHPSIHEAVVRIASDGIRRVVAFCLTPYYSRLSVAAYFRALKEAMRTQDLSLDVTYVKHWNDAPGLADVFADRVKAGIAALARDGFPDPYVLFTAHSLPKKVVEEGDPYEKELRETLEAIKARLPPIRSGMAYQSAGRTSEAWLEPRLEDVIEELAGRGERAILVVPFGFVSDHLEILWDVDVEAKGIAEQHGIRLERTESPNADPRFIEVMAAAIRPRLIM